MCDKDNDMIYENLSEEEFYQMQGKEYEDDLKKIQDILDKCYSRLSENKITVVNYNEIMNDNFNILDFIEKVENLNKEEDFINSHTRIDIKKNEENEIMVIYPSDTNNNFGKVNVEIITSLSEFIEKVIYLKKSDEYKTFYRGHGNWQYELVPGIYREQNKQILENESDYIRNIIASYPKFFTNCKSALDFLSVLQHHAFPTRLLDFSENPLIALYMACSSDGLEHSDTIRIDVPNNNFKYYDSDTVSVLANLAFMESSFSISDFKSSTKDQDESIRSFNKRIDIKKLIHLIRNEKPFFKPEINPEHLENTIVFVKPKQDFDRITHQNGLFALFGINNNKEEMPDIEFMEPPCNITHFVIPSNCKKRIIEELSSININEATVYCDMDHIASYYKNISKKHEIENIIKKKQVDFISKLI
ncbi:MAG: FRG domain-containing protein [Clostridium beijerinckii]|jgi:hypothetical protein|nr:FRG domain-containing protein [Clostridium beijerinckii]MCI1583792.1 FRG domain-containing protein [Clostridium beijerinckii]MCI1623856.1 FRG domain-containing protein [Clostridium beijerinckii]